MTKLIQCRSVVIIADVRVAFQRWFLAFSA